MSPQNLEGGGSRESEGGIVVTICLISTVTMALVKSLPVCHVRLFCSDRDFDIRLKQSRTSLGNKLCLINFYSILLLRTALILQLIELSVLEVGIL